MADVTSSTDFADNKAKRQEFDACFWWCIIFGIIGSSAVLLALYEGAQHTSRGYKGATLLIIMSLLAFRFLVNQIHQLWRVYAEMQKSAPSVRPTGTAHSIPERHSA